MKLNNSIFQTLTSEVLNGGCSHKCVNTEGDFKCESPVLSLSSDRMASYGNYDSNCDVPCIKS